MMPMRFASPICSAVSGTPSRRMVRSCSCAQAQASGSNISNCSGVNMRKLTQSIIDRKFGNHFPAADPQRPIRGRILPARVNEVKLFFVSGSRAFAKIRSDAGDSADSQASWVIHLRGRNSKENGRGGEIRTHDLLYPKQAR